MRFERLAVERFGHFASLDLDMSGGPGLVVIYGPNEAGKTTLLRALHGLLFGIDERTPYAFEYDYRAIALRAVLRDSSGQRLELTRLKKRKDSLLGSLRTDVGEVPLDALRFARYFGAITEDLYRSIFGFTHADLQQGSEVLQVAGLSELLGGGALGGSAEKIRGALGSLQLEAENLFKAKGKNPAINRSLTQLRDAKAALREAVFHQPQYAALTSGLARARDESGAAELELARLREREARLHTLLAVFEDFHEHLGLQRALAEPALQTTLDEPAAERARALASELSAAGTRLLSLDAELARLLARAEQPDADPALLSESVAVERLVRRVEAGAEQRQSLPRERERLAREVAALSAALSLLSPGTRPEDHVSWSLPPGELDRLRALATRWQRARQELQLAARALADDEAELAALQSTLAGLRAAAPDPEDMALLAELEAASARRAELDREELTLARLGAELDLGLARLRPPLAREALATLPLPRLAELDDFTARARDREGERRAALSDLSRETEELARARGELAALTAACDLPDPEALPATRARRDELWADLRRRLVDGETHAFGSLFARAESDYTDPEAESGASPTSPLANAGTADLATASSPPLGPPASGMAQKTCSFDQASSPLAPPGHPSLDTTPGPRDTAQSRRPGSLRTAPGSATARRQLVRSYERAVAGSDALADRLRDAAESLAKRTGLLRQIDRCEADLRGAQERLAGLDRAEDAWAEQWSALWRPLGVAPGSPATMLAWCREASSLRDLALELRRHELAAARLRPVVDDFTRRLRDRLGWPDASFLALVQGLRDRERAAQTARARAEATAARHASLQSAVARGRAAQEALSRDLVDLDATLRARLAGFGISGDLDPDAALARLHALEDMSQKLRDLEARRAVLARGEAALAAFDAELAALLARLGRTDEGLSPEHTVDLLSRRLAAARTAAAAAAQAREQAADKQRERDATADLQTAARDELAKLAARAGAHDIPALLDMSERTIQRARLQRRRDELAVRLTRALGDGPARQSYAAELQVARRDALLAEQTDLARRTSELDRRRAEASELKGKLENQLQVLGGDRAARINADCEALLADLGQQVDRYVLVQLAQQVLARVTERYARENQPAILHYTSDLLATITGGRHLRVVPQPEAGTLAALDRKGRLRLPSELSLGTREQLFLALRLAYVIDYCDRNEALPLVMDDVLVNFDEDRAATALQALRDVAKTTQVLFLTCHRHLMHLARQTTDTGAKLQIIELPNPPAGLVLATNAELPLTKC